MFMHHFTIKRRQFSVPIHDLRRFVLIRTHMIKVPELLVIFSIFPAPLLRGATLISALTFLQPLGKAANEFSPKTGTWPLVAVDNPDHTLTLLCKVGQ